MPRHRRGSEDSDSSVWYASDADFEWHKSSPPRWNYNKSQPERGAPNYRPGEERKRNGSDRYYLRQKDNPRATQPRTSTSDPPRRRRSDVRSLPRAGVPLEVMLAGVGVGLIGFGLARSGRRRRSKGSHDQDESAKPREKSSINHSSTHEREMRKGRVGRKRR